MSWFDTSGLASLAKNALKEAQKTIDKALDIKDDDVDDDSSSSPPIPSKSQHPSTLSSSTSTLSQQKESNENIQKLNMKHSVSNPTMSTQINSTSVWGSFSGSYFDNQTKIDDGTINTKAVVQSPPQSLTQSSKSMSVSDKNTTDTDSDGQPPVKRRDKSDNKDGQHHHHHHHQQQHLNNRLSLLSDNNSESVEVLSTPTTPASSLASPGNNSQSMTLPLDSDSVEIIGIETPTSELFSPLSASIVPTSISTSVTELSKVSSQESLDSIKDDDIVGEKSDTAGHSSGGGGGGGGFIAIVDDDLSLEDDSISYNTVSESMATIKDTSVNTISSINPITIAPSRTALHLSLGQSIQNKPGTVEGNQQKLDINKSPIKPTPQNPPVAIVASTSTSTSTIDESGKIIPNLLEDAMLEKSTDNLEHQSQLSDSTQSFEDVHQTMLREQNNFLIDPIDDRQSMATHSSSSEEHSSDIIKIICNKNISVNSDQEQASGHTSGDDIETNTSSDIEIISSPNGDSSSTNSAYRSSPHKNVNQNVMNKNLANAMVATKSTNKNTVHGDKTKISASNTLNVTNAGVATTSSVSQNKKKGHFRESSETSIQSNTSSEDLQLSNLSVNEKLQCRISELSEILEAREFKLITVGREMTALQDSYAELKLQMDTIKKNDGNHSEMTNVTDEYAQRMSALEKKFQQSIRERDQLRGQLKLMENDSAEKISKTDCERLISEKQFVINELKLEGDKLSKQILQHSNIIKKLRAKEKENDTILKRQKEQIEELTDELERLKKSLSAKDDMERSQIEAIHKLSSERKRFEKDNGLLKNQMDDLQQKLRTLQISFDVAKKEVNEKQQIHSELTKRSEILATLETENIQTQNQNHQIVNELKLLRDKLKQVDVEANAKEHQLRQANNELMHRLEEAELRAEQNVQSISESTIPLIRQCESLQSTLNARTLTWEKQEKQLLDQLHDQQAKLEKLTNFEKLTMEQQQQLQLRCSSLEERIAIALLQSEQSASDLQQKNVEFDLHTTDYKNEINLLKELNEKLSTQITEESNKKIAELEKQLQTERETYRLEKRRYQQEYESISNKTKMIGNSTNDNRENVMAIVGNVEQNVMNYSRQLGSGITTDGGAGDTSPTLSIGHASIPDSLSSNVWPLDDIDCISNYGGIVGTGSNIMGRQIGGTGSGSSIYLSNTTSQLETLQSNLKQRDGENNYLHWEISKLKSTRDSLMEELGKCTTQIEMYQEKLTENDGIIKQHSKLREEYDALLQMYGEKVEETQELKLDLQDVKDMYKTQIDDLLRQQRENRQSTTDS